MGNFWKYLICVIRNFRKFHWRYDEAQLAEYTYIRYSIMYIYKRSIQIPLINDYFRPIINLEISNNYYIDLHGRSSASELVVYGICVNSSQFY